MRVAFISRFLACVLHEPSFSGDGLLKEAGLDKLNYLEMVLILSAANSWLSCATHYSLVSKALEFNTFQFSGAL